MGETVAQQKQSEGCLDPAALDRFTGGRPLCGEPLCGRRRAGGVSRWPVSMGQSRKMPREDDTRLRNEPHEHASLAVGAEARSAGCRGCQGSL